MNTKIIKLDINNKMYETITAKQGDTESRFLLFHLFDASLPFDLTEKSVRVYGIKADGTKIFNDLVINDVKKGYCTLKLTNQMLAIAGLVKLELVIYSGNKKLSSIPFVLNVISSLNSDDAVVSTNEFTALMNGLAALSEYDIYKSNAKQVPGIKEEVSNLSSQLDTSTQQLKGQINEIAEAGTTMEAVQSKVSEMAEHGLIKAYTLADGTVEPKKISFFNTIYGNLFDKKTVVTNKQLNIANGTIGNMTDRTVSDFIKVNSSELLTFIYTQCRVCQYNASKEFISGHSNPITTIITDVNTSYIRVDFPSTRLDEIKIYKGADIPENDETYYKVDDTVDYSNLLTTENLFKIFKENNMSKTENIFNYKNSTLNYSINGSTGEITAFNDYSLSEYIYCESGINLSTNYKNVNINEYDENKEFIKLNKLPNTTITLDDKTKYIRFSYLTSKEKEIVVTISDTPSSIYIPYGYYFKDEYICKDDRAREKLDIWRNKNWAVLGDSITALQGYQKIVSEITGLNIKIDDGISGQGMKTMADRLTTENMTDIDLVTVFGGTNDYGAGGYHIGDYINDTKDSNTFCGFIHRVIDKIYTCNPNVGVMFFTPLQRLDMQGENALGYKLVDYADAIINVCGIYGIPVCDLNRISGFNKYNISIYTNDLLHPNNLGYSKLAPIIAKFIDNN